MQVIRAKTKFGDKIGRMKINDTEDPADTATCG